MKTNRIFTLLSLAAAMVISSSCHNSEREFENFDYTSVYFATQTPIRTLVMGEDTYDTTLDNMHMCRVYATMGGVYANEGVVDIGIKVDNTICDKLYFEDETTPVLPLPENYYSLGSNHIMLNGTLMGGVDVKLKDAFFMDPLARDGQYVLPLRMTQVIGADKILKGKSSVAGANPYDYSVWESTPKDYVLYCIKYINRWTASYLRRGEDKITIGSAQPVVVKRGEKFVEDDEVCSVTTKSLKEAYYTVTMSSGAESVECQLTLLFDKNECIILCDDGNFTVTGTGKYVVDGEKFSWGNKDRDALYLDYTIETTIAGERVKYESSDTMVLQTRGIKMEEFYPVYKN